MPTNNSVPVPASVGIIRFATANSEDSDQVGEGGYWNFHDGKWIIVSSDVYRTIGNASSGADIAQSWLFQLFENIYKSFGLPIYTSTGQVSSKTNAVSDWNVGKRLALPDFRGRAIIGDGTGQAGISRNRGAILGAETHTLTIAQMPSHNHKIDNVSSFNSGGSQYGGSSSQTSPQITTVNTGEGQPHNNIQPSIVIPIWMSTGTF